jgi:peptide-methionine (S)-S-oxide reductase
LLEVKFTHVKSRGLFIMPLNYRLLFSLSILSLLSVILLMPRTIFSSSVADSAPARIAGMNIDPPVDIKVTGTQTIVLAGGCFWGVEAVFEHLKGVSNVVSGFSGGTTATAHYNTVSNGTTGHAEAVKISYDPQQISLGKLLQIYFLIAHDPTQINRQTPDSGTQYRSAIFFANSEQQKVARKYIDKLNQAHIFSQPIATQLVPLTKFYAAEDYHQNFIDRNPNYPYVVIHDRPKIDRLRQQFPELLKLIDN